MLVHPLRGTDISKVTVDGTGRVYVGTQFDPGARVQFAVLESEEQILADGAFVRVRNPDAIHTKSADDRGRAFYTKNRAGEDVYVAVLDTWNPDKTPAETVA